MQLGLCRPTEARAHLRISVPILAVAFSMCLGTSAYADCPQPPCVKLTNLTTPLAYITVGQTSRIQITGAAPNSPVTFTCTSPPGGGACGTDGTIQYPAGSTDGAGSFTLDNFHTSSDVSEYTELWYVN